LTDDSSAEKSKIKSRNGLSSSEISSTAEGFYSEVADVQDHWSMLQQEQQGHGPSRDPLQDPTGPRKNRLTPPHGLYEQAMTVGRTDTLYRDNRPVARDTDSVTEHSNSEMDLTCIDNSLYQSNAV
jgi:hypothetical protein